jgi:hypothetical protein
MTLSTKKMILPSKENMDKITKVKELIALEDFQIDHKGHYPFRKEGVGFELEFKYLLNFYRVSLQCPYCDVRCDYELNDDKIECITSCSQPGGLEEIIIELDVPSGKMFFANDLRPWFSAQDNFDVNTISGVVKTMRSYEKASMAHGFVGNTCPSIFQIDSRNITISNLPAEDIYNKDIAEWTARTKEEIEKDMPPGKILGSICTDLWWYSIVDCEELEKRFDTVDKNIRKNFNKYSRRLSVTALVEPGRYRIRHQIKTAWDNFDQHQGTHYAIIEKI